MMWNHSGEGFIRLIFDDGSVEFRELKSCLVIELHACMHACHYFKVDYVSSQEIYPNNKSNGSSFISKLIDDEIR